MRKNEPTALYRVAGPIPFYDPNGALKKNLTFLTGSGEVFYYRSATNDWAAAASNAAELGGANTTGVYYVQMAQAEVNQDKFVGIKLVKAGYDDQFWFESIDKTPDANIASASAAAIADIQGQIPGLLMRRSFTDQCVYSAKKVLTSARVREFADEATLATAAGADADGAHGEIHRWRWTSVDPGTGLASSWKLVQEL